MRAAEFLKTPHDIEEPDLFRHMIKVSFTLHVAALLFFGLRAAIFPTEPIILDPVIKVDMVGLPGKFAQLPPEEVKSAAQPPPPKVEPKAEPKIEPKVEAPKPREVVALHPDKAKKEKALAKIRALERQEKAKSALEKIQEQVAADEAKATRQAKVAQLLRGNVISAGTALHGVTKSEFNQYIGALQAQVKQHWNLPEWLQNDSLKATVIAFIDDRGSVTKRIIRKSSGDDRFDSLALKAVDESSPFPKPPDKFVNVVRVDGIFFNFP